MQYRLAVAVAGWCAGCAVTATTCPTGTKLETANHHGSRAEWCASTDAPIAELPVGRTYLNALSVTNPAPQPAGVNGPYTTWFPNGALASHGHYVAAGGSSLPEGLWAFWRPDGKRSVVGVYHRGEPIGCFASWDDKGDMTTGTVTGSELHAAPCTPPRTEELAIVEGRARPVVTRAWADITVQSFIGPNHLGAVTRDQPYPEPATTFAFSASARARIGRLRVGPVVGLGVADLGKVERLGGTVAWQLPAFTPRLDTEVGVELSAVRVSATAFAANQFGSTDISFWSAQPAAQAGLAFELTPNLAAVAGVRVDGVPRRTVDRTVTYCAHYQDCMTENETWKLGGFSYGANLGLRLVLR